MTKQNTSKQTKIVIIGAGKVGKSLEALFSKHYAVTLISREIELFEKQIRNAQLVLITTNDESIELVCEQITHLLNPDTVVSHCSGALGSEKLLSAKQQGAYTASSHPLNTFPSIEAGLHTLANEQHGTFLYCEGDQLALALITEVFQTCGFQIVTIDSQAKTAYHAACVFACNYLNALMDLSLRTAALYNIDQTQFWHAIQPLIQATLSNINQHGVSEALSGPIARGDVQTVDQHIDFLSKKDQSIGDAYILLAEHALQLAQQQGKLTEHTLSQLKEIINR